MITLKDYLKIQLQQIQNNYSNNLLSTFTFLKEASFKECASRREWCRDIKKGKDDM